MAEKLPPRGGENYPACTVKHCKDDARTGRVFSRVSEQIYTRPRDCAPHCAEARETLNMGFLLCCTQEDLVGVLEEFNLNVHKTTLIMPHSAF